MYVLTYISLISLSTYVRSYRTFFNGFYSNYAVITQIFTHHKHKKNTLRMLAPCNAPLRGEKGYTRCFIPHTLPGCIYCRSLKCTPTGCCFEKSAKLVTKHAL